MLRPTVRPFLAVLMVAAAARCGSPDPTGGDTRDGGGATDGDARDGADGLGEPGSDAPTDAFLPAGPATFVVADLPLVIDRICDFDGDGLGDNAVAELGPSQGTIFAAGINSFISGFIDDGRRMLFHSPRVDGRASPRDEELVLIMLDAVDVDDPPVLDDDFLGAEPFFASWKSLDACGEPIGALTDARLGDEGIAAEAGQSVASIGIGDTVEVEAAEILLRPSADWSSAEADLCYLASAGSLGALPPLYSAWGDLTVLEVIVGGGEALGYPAFSGLNPDVDMDGDGLERIEVDGDGHVSSCIDGDLTVIEGRDCWGDARIADGFAFTYVAELVSAVFAGREPGWEERVEGSCDDPPETSLFDAR